MKPLLDRIREVLDIVIALLVILLVLSILWRLSAPWAEPAPAKPAPGHQQYMDTPRAKGARPGVSHVPQANDPARRERKRVGFV
jgi:hypothetical protein